MSRVKVHLRIASQISGRIYTDMKALCGNKRARQFDVSAHETAYTCESCIRQRRADKERAAWIATRPRHAQHGSTASGGSEHGG